MFKGLQIALAMLGPYLDFIGAFLLSAYVVAGSQKMENVLQSLKEFTSGLVVGASNLVYLDTKGFEHFLNAPISETPGIAAISWLLYPFATSAIVIVYTFYLPLIATITFSFVLLVFALISAPKILRTSVRRTIYAFSIILLFTALFYFIPLNKLAMLLFIPIAVLVVFSYIIAIPLGFAFLVRWIVEEKQEKKVSMLGLLFLLSGFVVQGVFNFMTLL